MLIAIVALICATILMAVVHPRRFLYLLPMVAVLAGFLLEEVIVQKNKVKVLPIFDLIGEHVEESEMYRAFNMGVGMIFVVNKDNVDNVLEKTDGYVIGHIEHGEKGCDLV